MNRTKMIVLGAFMATIAALFQAAPVLLSEVAVILTIFSDLPIYIAARIKPSTGVLSYLVAAFLIMLISTHESLFFLCTNGVVGLSLGICYYYIKNHQLRRCFLIVYSKKLITMMISSIVLTISLSFMNYGIGIPVFGVTLPGPVGLQLTILFLFSLLYNFIYSSFMDFIYKRLKL